MIVLVTPHWMLSDHRDWYSDIGQKDKVFLLGFLIFVPSTTEVASDTCTDPATFYNTLQR